MHKSEKGWFETLKDGESEVYSVVLLPNYKDGHSVLQKEKKKNPDFVYPQRVSWLLYSVPLRIHR
jgi:hypothetical protein